MRGETRRENYRSGRQVVLRDRENREGNAKKGDVGKMALVVWRENR